MRHTLHFLRAFLFVPLVLSGIHDMASADSIFLTVTSTKQAANPGETATFEGTISNNLASGETLDAFSYFFDFNNFDASALSNPERSLPKGGIDFSIPNGTASSITELFSVTLLPGAIAGQSY